MSTHLDPGSDGPCETFLAAADRDATAAVAALHLALTRAASCVGASAVLENVDDLVGMLDGADLARSLARRSQHRREAREHALDARDLARLARVDAERRLALTRPARS